MNIYDNYLSTIREAIGRDRRVKASYVEGLNGPELAINKGYNTRKFFSQKADMMPLPSLLSLVQAAGLKANVNQSLGAHPDFEHLRKSGAIEYHYIVSTFIDIKGSTNLFKDYDLETILVITNTIQRAAIHTCVAFGGYVHRLQGDGVFAYFGGKGIDKKDANIKALTACAVFTHFVKNDLKRIFDQEGIEEISTRIGIDYGDDANVMWAMAGIGQCCEVTTYSLHTSLASKMQEWAKPNGIIVGKNVREISLLSGELFALVRNSNGDVEKQYIFEDRKKNFLYSQYNFDWSKYLRSLPYLEESNEGLIPKTRTSNGVSSLSQLRNTAGLVSSGGAFTDPNGNISTANAGVKNQPHRFHFES